MTFLGVSYLWGDGLSSSSGTAYSPGSMPSMPCPVYASHSYTTAGTYAIIVTATATYSPGVTESATSNFSVTVTPTSPMSPPPMSPPTVTITGEQPAYEGGAAGVFRFTRTGNTGQPLNVSFNFSGTAASLMDYNVPPSFTIPAGLASANLLIPATDDTASELTETITLTLNATAEYGPGTPSYASINLFDNDAQLVSVAKVADATEWGADGIFRFTRTGDLQSPLAIGFTVGGTAVINEDYYALLGTATFAAGAASADVPVIAMADGVYDPGETVTAAVAVGTGYTVGNSTPATVAIADTVAVTVARLTDAVEGGAVGTFRFTRTGDSSQPRTIEIDVAGDAAEGADYLMLPRTVTFGAGQVTSDLSVSALADGLVEGGETVSVAVVAGASYVPGWPDTASLRIIGAASPTASGDGYFVPAGSSLVTDLLSGVLANDSDPDGDPLAAILVTAPAHGAVALDPDGWFVYSPTAGYLGTDSFSYRATDGAAQSGVVTVQLTVVTGVSVAWVSDATESGSLGAFRFTRTGELSQALTVNYAVGTSSTATAGVDYAALSGAVNFAPGASTADVAVAPFDDPELEMPETVDVKVLAGSGYVPAYGAVQAVTIRDNETGTASGVVWDDVNGNGVQDSYEPGLAGVTVVLTPDAGGPVYQTLTDSTGAYALTGILGGVYAITLPDVVAAQPAVTPANSPTILQYFDISIVLGIGANPDTNYGYTKVWHHLIPQHFFNLDGKSDDLVIRNAAASLAREYPAGYIHNPENGWYLFVDDHYKVHSDLQRISKEKLAREWNKDWHTFFRTHPNATKAEIEATIKHLKSDYGMTDLVGRRRGMGISVAASDKLTYLEHRMADKAAVARLRQQRGTTAWAPSKTEETRAVAAYDDRMAKKFMTEKTTRLVSNSDINSTKKKTIVKALTALGTILAIAGPVDAAVNLDRQMLENDLDDAKDHLIKAYKFDKSGANVDAAKSERLAYVDKITQILVNHFGVDEITAAFTGQALRNAVLGDLLPLEWK